jgi:hypothetical protein
MTARPPRDHPAPPVRRDPQDHWKLTDEPERQPLCGGLRDTAHLLAILTTTIAVVAVGIALGVLLLAT